MVKFSHTLYIASIHDSVIIVSATMTLPAISLSDRQAAFVKAILSGLKSTQALEIAGYAPHPSAASRLLSVPEVQAALEIGMRRRLQASALVSLEVLENLRDGAASEQVRFAAAKALLDRAGYVPARHAKADPNDKAPSERSVAEMLAEVDRLQGELASRVRDVSPPGEQIEGEVFDPA
jgi:phage terminase small subunit